MSDLIEVTSRWSQEAKVEGLRFNKQPVVLALEAVSAAQGYSVRPDSVVLLEVTNLGDSSPASVLEAALSTKWMKKHYPAAAKATHLLSERAGERTMYVSIRASVEQVSHILRDVQYDCQDASGPRWAFSSTDASGAAAAAKRARGGSAPRFLPATGSCGTERFLPCDRQSQ